MSRKKLVRFEINKINPNVIEPGKDLFTRIKGNWRKIFFGNEHPVVVELACGRGEYTIGLARQYPELNFIGVDRKGDRIGSGSEQAMNLGLTNVGFLRTDIVFLENFFEDGEVSELWITFPDPQYRIMQHKNRLTHPRYLALYTRLLEPGGVIHLKTDNTEFFDFSLAAMRQGPFTDFKYTYDLYTSELNEAHLGIKTKYEKIFYDKGFSIKYLQCRKAV